jgi:hypothetical protein
MYLPPLSSLLDGWNTSLAMAHVYSEIPDEPKDTPRPSDRALFATRASWVVNWFLFFVKFYVVIYSRSKSVVASLVDSAGTAIPDLPSTHSKINPFS